MHDFQEPVGPYGEHVASETYRNGVQNAARDVLAAIDAFRRGDLDYLRLSRAITFDRYLREIAPSELILGFRAIESEFDHVPDDASAHLWDACCLAELRAGCDEYLGRIRVSFDEDVEALRAHLEQWHRERADLGNPVDDGRTRSR